MLYIGEEDKVYKLTIDITNREPAAMASGTNSKLAVYPSFI